MQRPTEMNQPEILVQEDQMVAVEGHLEKQAHIILAELRSARTLAQRLNQDPAAITQPYLAMLQKHYAVSYQTK